jgi:hypothetical protein
MIPNKLCAYNFEGVERNASSDEPPTRQNVESLLVIGLIPYKYRYDALVSSATRLQPASRIGPRGAL